MVSHPKETLVYVLIDVQPAPPLLLYLKIRVDSIRFSVQKLQIFFLLSYIITRYKPYTVFDDLHTSCCQYNKYILK